VNVASGSASDDQAYELTAGQLAPTVDSQIAAFHGGQWPARSSRSHSLLKPDLGARSALGTTRASAELLLAPIHEAGMMRGALRAFSITLQPRSSCCRKPLRLS